jgi:tetratricopeptide (TPR) repeat protein
MCAIIRSATNCKISMLAVAAFCFVCCSQHAAAAGGGQMSGNSSFEMPAREMSPQEQARLSYNSGVKKLKDAAEYEADAAKATDPKKIAKANEKAQKSYEKAYKEFAHATEKMPTMHEAWNYVGFTQRHLGHYEQALVAYAKALELKPNYPEALEYRGEAFLGVNAIDDAKQTYLALYRTSPPLANQLMTAMHVWLDQRRKDPTGVEEPTLDGFASWIKEREAIAGQSASLTNVDRW